MSATDGFFATWNDQLYQGSDTAVKENYCKLQPRAKSQAPISVPVGKTILGRIFNVLGDPVDELGPCPADTKLPIHKNAPAFVENTPKIDTNK